MPDLLASKDRVARKAHICSYCGDTIQKGETYEWAKLAFDGELYEWKNHKKCGFIAQEIWSFVDPDNGMTDDDFIQGVVDVCRAFICPMCSDPAKEDDSCYVCLDKVYEFLKENELVRCRDGFLNRWKAVPRRKETEL